MFKIQETKNVSVSTLGSTMRDLMQEYGDRSAEPQAGRRHERGGYGHAIGEVMRTVRYDVQKSAQILLVFSVVGVVAVIVVWQRRK